MHSLRLKTIIAVSIKRQIFIIAGKSVKIIEL